MPKTSDGFADIHKTYCYEMGVGVPEDVTIIWIINF